MTTPTPLPDDEKAKPVTLWRGHDAYYMFFKNRPRNYPAPTEGRWLPAADFDALVAEVERLRALDQERSRYGRIDDDLEPLPRTLSAARAASPVEALMGKDGKQLYSRAAIKVVDALIHAGHFDPDDAEDHAFAYSTAQHALNALSPAPTREGA